MKSLTFVFISIMSGVIAGLVLAGINMIIVEPLIDKAIEIETSNAMNSGENVDMEELTLIRTWQKSGSFIAGALMGAAFGAVLGIVYFFIRKTVSVPNDAKYVFFLSLVMCTVLFVIPFLKYPGNPPAVGNPETIYYREALYVGFLAVSSVAALAVGILYYKLKNTYRRINIVVPLFYFAVIGLAFVVFPPNPDNISISMDLVNSFRIASGMTIVLFWIVLGISFGLLWQNLRPDQSSSKRITH
jgi:predicted cobalt transporter CbtA